jgi:diguanylate cyclase (GGDEF)-like protein
MTAPRIPIEPFADFAAASRAALELLQDQLGMGLWMVTRTAGDDWIILGASNREARYAVSDGDVFRWSDSFCSRMVRGEGPNIAPCAAEVASYRDAPIARQLPIGSYVGIPLRTAAGELFGTVCAIDPEERTTALEAAAPLLDVIGRLLATVLDRDLRLGAEARRAERAEAAAMRDELTGLWNRRAWEQLRASEESRCRRYGHSACVLSIDLDGLKAVNDTEGHGAGDQLLRRAACALRNGVREQDVVARVGGDEFAVLLVECLEEQGRIVQGHHREGLDCERVSASIGFARREPVRGLDHAWSHADEAMYEEKRARKGGTRC